METVKVDLHEAVMIHNALVQDFKRRQRNALKRKGSRPSEIAMEMAEHRQRITQWGLVIKRLQVQEQTV